MSAVAAGLFVLGLVLGALIFAVLIFLGIYVPSDILPEAQTVTETVARTTTVTTTVTAEPVTLTETRTVTETTTATVTETMTVVPPRPRVEMVFKVSGRALTPANRTDQYFFTVMGHASAVIVKLNVSVVPHANRSDGAALLTVLLNGELPSYGDFGLTRPIRQYLAGLPPPFLAVATRSLALVPLELGGVGSRGVRVLVFNGTALTYPLGPRLTNQLLLVSWEEGKGDVDWDTVVVHSIEVHVVR